MIRKTAMVRVRLVALASAAIAFPNHASAQEDSAGPAPPLEFPSEAKPEAPRGVSLQFFRAAVEKSADFGLCKALMTKDGVAMPRDARNHEYCPPNYASKVAANEGFIQWAPNARPLKCGDCIGRPFMSAETNTTSPNLRRAVSLGQLTFLSTTGPNRTITYPLTTYFTCKTQNGAREGDLAIDIKFDPPVIGDPGFWESVVSFFTAGALSNFIDGKIRENVQSLPSVGSTQGRCTSLGVERGTDGRFDLVKYDLPSTAGGPGPVAAAGAMIGQTATVRLISVKRLPLPAFVAPEHARPGDPAAGQFKFYVNGAIAVLPPAGLALPPEGGSAPLNFCKTVDVGGRSALQILFTNDLGGGVWSQFARAANFGAGGARKMTTGRSIVIPAMPGPPDPVTGKPTSGGKPQPFMLREFELTYDVAFNQPPLSVEPQPAPKRRVNPALRDAARPGGQLSRSDAPQATADPCKAL